MSSTNNPFVSATPVQTSAPATASGQPLPTFAAPAGEAQPSKLDQGLLSAANLLNVSLGTLQILASGIKNPQLGLAAGIAQEVVPLIEAAIAKLLEVKDSETTYGQLEKLRFTPKW